MKRVSRRVLSLFLTLCLTVGLVPVTALPALAASTTEAYTLKNDSITVEVSGDNGGFSISTGTGDKLSKADDNKNLLYHSGEYDTSFTSFEVTEGSQTRQYIFGGDYGFLGLSSSKVAVTQTDSEIDAVWSVGKLTFTQKISLANSGANEHGMVNITYKVDNAGSDAVSVKARVLLDTALGDQDYAYYEVMDADQNYQSISRETVITDTANIPQNFFAYDDPYNPTITAYTVNKQDAMPYQVAFGHWNNLASSVFDFAPEVALDFTDRYNDEYQTADSAYALYYDLGTVEASGGTGDFSTYYGVYSHEDVAAGSSLTVDVTAPTALVLNNDKTAYVRQSQTGVADFEVQTQLKNLLTDTAQTYSSVTLCVYTSSSLKPLDGSGAAMTSYDYGGTDPYTVTYADVNAGETVSDVLYFAAQPAADAQYAKIRLEVYDTSSLSTVTQKNLLGSSVFYVLCPGTDGTLPQITFTNLSPDIVYSSGTRHLFAAGTNIDMLYTALKDGKCTLSARSAAGTVLSIAKENIFQSDEGTLDIILSDPMTAGAWSLELKWTQDAIAAGLSTAATQTAPALSFTVSDDTKYKNDTYGVVAVVETAGGGTGIPVYRIMSFTDEAAFQTYQNAKSYVEILLVFRGSFEIKATAQSGGKSVPAVLTATSLKSSVDADATNVISINNCLDFENGVLTIQYDAYTTSLGGIHIDFDGDLYTSDARTSVWQGKAAFTVIQQGYEYGLIPYDTDGVRKTGFNEEPISLVWPSVYGAAQTIAGMAFNLAYGQLGVMKNADGSEAGRVISFSAKLDLGFLVPDKKALDAQGNSTDNTYWTRLQNFWKFYNETKTSFISYWAADNVDSILDFSNEQSDTAEGTASVMVQDILYGCGVGFVGVHFSVNVKLPNYVENMPKLEGTLEVNTIGNWSFGVEGKMEMETMTVEFALSLKSHNNIPVPDKIYFFISGFEPGVNVDGCGVVWITGGGGGIDNLYDTIFMTGGVPPLKLLLTVSLDIVKVLSARADLSLALTGISFTATDIKLKNTDIVALKKAALQFDWYPNLYLMASVKMSLFDLIVGSGYIVLEGKNYSDWFFEAFVRASVQVPKSIPLVGGMELAGVDLGLNSEKVWGMLRVLGIKLGLTYYWGGDVDFGTGSFVSPTYPQLLGMDAIPVYYDSETDQTLYLRVGTNLTVAASSSDSVAAGTVGLLASGAFAKSDGDRRNHTFNLGTRTGGADAVVQISFDADSLADAQSATNAIIAGGITSGSDRYALTLYDEAKNNADTANANVTYDESTGKGCLAFSVTNASAYSKTWAFTTPRAAEIVLYNVEELPELTSISSPAAAAAGSSIALSWTGTRLDELDSIKFYLTDDQTNESDSGYLLGEVTDTSAGTASFTVPADIPGGSYTLRAVYTQDGTVSEEILGTPVVAVTNSNTPDTPTIATVASAGDLKIRVQLQNPTADAYEVTVYQYDSDSAAWVASDVAGVVTETSSLTDGALTVGGSYTYMADKSGGETAPAGLSAGTPYYVGVTAVNYVDADHDGTDDTAVRSGEVFWSSAITLPEPTPPDVTLTANRTATAVARTVGKEIQSFDTYTSSDLTFAVAATEAVTGTWTLDGETTDGHSGTLSGTAGQIVLTGLEEGDHTLTLSGTDGGGDGFRKDYTFTVDTLPPRLLLASPTNGSFFNENGTLTVSGVTDADARFTVYCDGAAVCAGKTLSELSGTLDADGTFSFTVTLPDAHAASSHAITVTAADTVGNSTTSSATVYHGGLNDIDHVSVYADGVLWNNKNLVTSAVAQRSAQLTLVATTKTGAVSFVLTDASLVSWSCSAVQGSASITDAGVLTMGADSIGYVTGALRVASGGSMTASLTFGAEAYEGAYAVTAGATLGGSVTGDGAYQAGDTVTLTAVPDAGYHFSGWTLSGVSVADLSSKTITFTMPENSVVATASFTADITAGSRTILYAEAGERVTHTLPAGADPDRYGAYYLSGGNLVYVAMSAVTDGTLVFVAPVTGTYYLTEIGVTFQDIAGNWAENEIEFAVSRGLFNGVGDNTFAPGGTMTRAMFVTVLWRLAGSPSASGTEFTDVPNNLWYSEAVAWAVENGLADGYGGGTFGPNDNITREQMCVLLSRYASRLDLSGSGTGTSAAFADAASISTWAKEAVALCHSLGLVNGKPGNLFDPAGLTTRAEACAVFERLIRACLLEG